ncbi:MAG: M28 family peptidase [Luteitalea sp.]|nr:M28 family peptidase [Luteitalea sp.]
MRRSMRLRVAMTLSLFVTATPIAQERMEAPGQETIRQQDLRADLFFLASDGFRGRLTDTPENALAASFIESRFARLGLKPAGPNGSYYQRYNLMKATLGEGNALDLRRSSSAEIHMRPGQDYYPQRFSANARAQGEVVFAGFGITSPAHQYDDYGDAVRGRIVLVLDHEPRERDPKSPFDGVVTTQKAVAIEKALAAQAKGATGILFVADVHNHPEEENFESEWRSYWPSAPPIIERYTLARWSERVRIPAAQISPTLAATLVSGTGRTLGDLAKSAETPNGIEPVPLPGVEVKLSSSIDHHLVPDQNVVALLEGEDPTLKEEAIIVCAHYDHNGADEGGEVLNGADDNGSGIVALLEIAEAYVEAAKRGQRPRRSILFAAWNSEERGLLGAWAYTEQPLIPLAQTIAVLNMDMVGRNEEVPVGGGGRFRGLEVQTAQSNENAVNLVGSTRVPDLAAEVERVNQDIGLELKKRYDNNPSNLLRRSDQWPFLQKGVPAIWFHTGLHPDYHTQYDAPEKINYGKMEKIARLVYQVSWRLANAGTRPSPPTMPTADDDEARSARAQ